MMKSLTRNGWKDGRARFASSGSETIGYVAQKGCCGTPLDVYGIGWVGHGASPGTSVAVATSLSTTGLIGFPVSRSHRYRKNVFNRSTIPLTGFPATLTSN